MRKVLKNGFYLKAKHGLNLKMDLRPNWSQFGRGNRGEEKGEEKERRRGRGRGRKEIKQAKIKRYGTLDFCMETNLDHGTEWIYGTLRLCMVNILSPKLGF